VQFNLFYIILYIRLHIIDFIEYIYCHMAHIIKKVTYLIMHMFLTS